MERTPSVIDNKAFIQKTADAYQVPYKSMLRILHHEYWDSATDYLGLKDLIQNDCAAQSTLKATGHHWLAKLSYIFQLENNVTGFNSDDVAAKQLVEKMTAEEDMKKFWEIFHADKESACLGLKHDRRDGNTNWMFYSLGIAQIQIYLALSLAVDNHIKDQRIVASFKDGEGAWNLSNVAKVLATDDNDSIEILAAELQTMRYEWWNKAKLDISAGLPLKNMLDENGNLVLHKASWLLSDSQQKKLEQLAKEHDTAGLVPWDELTGLEKAALAIPDPIPAEDIYLQLHLRGNFTNYALRYLPSQKLAGKKE